MKSTTATVYRYYYNSSIKLVKYKHKFVQISETTETKLARQNPIETSITVRHTKSMRTTNNNCTEFSQCHR